MVSIAETPPIVARDRGRDRRVIRTWLYVVALMIVAMVVVLMAMLMRMVVVLARRLQ